MPATSKIDSSGDDNGNNNTHKPDKSTLDQGVVQQAALWMARLWSDNASDADRAACAQWRAQHPEHERAWQRLHAVEHKLTGAAGVTSNIGNQILKNNSVSQARRKTMQLLGLSVLAGGLTYTVGKSGLWLQVAAEYTSATGETRQIALPDGTAIVLNTGTAIDVDFTSQERKIILRSGEILVTTGHDPASARTAASTTYRPLIVYCSQGSVQAIGTRFSVHQRDSDAHVAVFQGAVDIRAHHLNGNPTRLSAGESTDFTQDGVDSASPAQETQIAWTRGMLVAEQMTVADFIRQVGRYRRGILVCNKEVADLRITGVFSLRDTDRALENLTLSLPVKLMYRTRYWVTVQAA